jgi:ATP-dependent DNA helicase PIF1
MERVLKDRRAVKRWEQCKVLVIDEASMLRPHRLELLNKIAMDVKKSRLPFGGIQIILSGDFMQLSPVMERIADVNVVPHKYCFQTNAWREAGLLKSQGGTIQLEEVIRQKGDTEFIRILNEVRRGRISQESLDRLNECKVDKKERPTDGIIPTKLFCYNVEADNENSKKLAELPGPVISIIAIDTWKVEPKAIAAQRSMIDSMSKIAAKSIHLKMGAQVMLLRNCVTGSGKLGLVNGSKGVIVGMSRGFPTVFFENGDREIVRPVEYEVDIKNVGRLTRSQIPLKLAW